jgi:hypothetical protein
MLTTKEQVQKRCVNRESTTRLSRLLNLAIDPYVPDWEVECADVTRIEEFIGLYERTDLSEEDRFALMALIVCSFDHWLRDGGADETIVQQLRRQLLGDFNLHRSTVHYWCLPEEPDLDNGFCATPFMREIWKEATA